MEILSVQLENFKSHRQSYFEFEAGTNAICGENGAGKTSILEAIAWTLFNYSDYSKEELIRKGCSQAQVVVKFISSLDGRTYQIQRCTKRGYELYDPQLKRKLDYTKVEDVTLWLRQHLGVGQNTELSKLFSETIGIPQGTLTTDFLRKPGDRKKIFDPILKVEEYKQAFTQGRDLENHAKLQVSQLEQAINHYELQLQNWDELQHESQQLILAIEADEVELETLTQQLAVLKQTRDEFAQLAKTIQSLESRLQTAKAQISSQLQANQIRQQSLEKAQESLQVCISTRPGYLAYQEAEAKFQQFTKLQSERQTLLQQRERYIQRLNQSEIDLQLLQDKVNRAQDYQAQLDRFQPLIERQETHELECIQQEKTLQEVQSAQRDKQRVEAELLQLQDKLTVLQESIEKLRSLEAIVRQIPELEKQQNTVSEKLSRIAAAQQFKESLSKLVKRNEQKRDRYLIQLQQTLQQLDSYPQLQTQVKNTFELADLSHSEMLESLQAILNDLHQQTSPQQLQQHLEALQGQLNTAYQCRTDFASLAAKLQDQKQLGTEIQERRSHLSKLTFQVTQEPEIVKQLEATRQQLAALKNPRAQAELLAQEIQQLANIQQKYSGAQQLKEKLLQEIQTLEEQLRSFDELDRQIEECNQIKTQHQPQYLDYLKHEEAAQHCPRLEAELQSAIAQLQDLENQHQALQVERDSLTASFDPQQQENLETEYHLKFQQQAQIQGSLAPKRSELARIQQQIEQYKQLAQERDRAATRLQQCQQTLKFITDSRSFYNQASPRITKFYLEEISREADKLFRELLNRQNVALEWTEDYEIVVQEDGHRRGFKSLSGGEQMCAALAVRLALLRIIADIDIAFFDEPTTNMDLPRRRQLADALARLSGSGSQIQTFRQLFVISHDDTFENLSHFIHVRRDASVSVELD
ncbi:SMC family ATPase [Kamptonema cortianum]|uniref:Nuclease SbcCD subunit C n=1 Tax=Geitlerinema calcuttense NRMC-F 0142 TaxID=2922238 RepID=A0ABT7LWW2_9CYAN|nr:SMC family ATPase [Geitlerinema calcuttense]MDK3158251.1 SMC family ATPase [Kamptonema cortianum]MDL5056511.1 SMC family ATPase [Geitlerinema calcuttense NRMC-F 0142]